MGDKKEINYDQGKKDVFLLGELNTDNSNDENDNADGLSEVEGHGGLRDYYWVDYIRVGKKGAAYFAGIKMTLLLNVGECFFGFFVI